MCLYPCVCMSIRKFEYSCVYVCVSVCLCVSVHVSVCVCMLCCVAYVYMCSCVLSMAVCISLLLCVSRCPRVSVCYAYFSLRTQVNENLVVRLELFQLTQPVQPTTNLTKFLDTFEEVSVHFLPTTVYYVHNVSLSAHPLLTLCSPSVHPIHLAHPLLTPLHTFVTLSAHTFYPFAPCFTHCSPFCSLLAHPLHTLHTLNPKFSPCPPGVPLVTHSLLSCPPSSHSLSCWSLYTHSAYSAYTFCSLCPPSARRVHSTYPFVHTAHYPFFVHYIYSLCIPCSCVPSVHSIHLLPTV